MTGVQGFLDSIAGHHGAGFPESDLLAIKDKSMGENFCHTLKLMVRSDDKVSGRGEFDKAIGKMAPALNVEPVEWFVQQENMGFLSKSSGDEGPLLLASRELVDLAVCEALEIHGGDGFLDFLVVDFSESPKVSQMWKATHRDDITNPDRKVALVPVDLRKVGDFPSVFGQIALPPLEAAALLFQEAG